MSSASLLCGDTAHVPVSVCANLESVPRTGRIMVAGVLLSAAEARGLAERLVRAADGLDVVLAVRCDG